MSWFERYGIPGTYFAGLVLAWTFAVCPRLLNSDDIGTVLGLAGILSLPSGYIISIIGQSAYLSWLGFHRAALDKCKFTFIAFEDDDPRRPTKDEAIIEARTTLLAVLAERMPIPLESHQYMRDWIRRRFDVVAVNLSLVIATVLATGVAVAVYLIRGVPLALLVWPFPVAILIINVSVIAAMIWNICKLRGQIIESIAGIYRAYGR